VLGTHLLAPGALAGRLAGWSVATAMGLVWIFRRVVSRLTINGG